MSRNAVRLNKKERRVYKKKRAIRNRIILIASAVIVVCAAFAAWRYIAAYTAGTEVYTDEIQTVTLRPNGRFRAELAHGESFRGRYNKTDERGWTVVEMTYGGVTVNAMIMQGNFMLPDEWQDTCEQTHNSVLPMVGGESWFG